jgi:small-conductance mechanosensitive channel
VGFRNTRIRILGEHLVTLPNSVITNAYIENISRRQVNLEIMRRFRDAGIQFAFPSQTIYMDRDNAETGEK